MERDPPRPQNAKDICAHEPSSKTVAGDPFCPPGSGPRPPEDEDGVRLPVTGPRLTLRAMLPKRDHGRGGAVRRVDRDKKPPPPFSRSIGGMVVCHPRGGCWAGVT